MQSRPEPVDLETLPPAHRALFQRQQTAFQAQQTANDELRARVDLLTDTNRRLEHLIDELRRAIYDKKSEKRPLDDRQLAFEDLEGAVAEAEEAAAAPGTSTGPSSAKSPCPSTQSRASAQGPGTDRTRHRTGQHAVPLRVRPDDPHRRGPHRAAGHRAGAASGHRHGATEVRLPHLRAGRDPGRRAGAPHRGRAADRGGAGARCSFPSTAIIFRCTVNRRSTPARAWTCTAPRSPAGWARRRFIWPRWWIAWPGI